MNKVKELVLGVLEKGAATSSEISDEISVNIDNVRSRISELIEEGLVYRTGSTRLNEFGRKEQVLTASEDVAELFL